MMDTLKLRRRLYVVAITTPLLGALAACGGGDNATSDSAGGTMAMSDSAGMGATTGAAPNNAGMMDQSVAGILAMANMAEIESSQLAGTKARNADVKAYARQMIDEHQKASQQLQTMASTNSWTLPDSTGMNAGSQSGMTGATGTGTGASTGAANSATGTNSGTATGGGGTNTTSPSTVQGSPQLDASVQQMHQQHMTLMTALKTRTGADFDRDYMDGQIAAHQQTLDLLRQYVNNVQNSELRTFAQTMQGSVEQHLQKAQDIRGRLGGATTSAGGAR